jgi:hypothetical protein
MRREHYEHCDETSYSIKIVKFLYRLINGSVASIATGYGLDDQGVGV